MSEEFSIDDAFDSEKPLPEITEEVTDTKGEKPDEVEPAEVEKIKKVEETEQPEEPPTSENDTNDNPYFKAMMDERGKRQDTQNELKALQQQLEELQKKPDEPAPDFYDDPDKAFDYRGDKIEQRMNNRLIAMSEEMVRAQYEDYDTTFDAFTKAAETNPVLLDEVRQSANPALKAYQLGKKQAKLEEIGDPEDFAKRTEDKIRAQVEKELREKIEAEQQKSTDAKSKTLPSLANENSSGGNEIYVEPTMDDVFKKNY